MTRSPRRFALARPPLAAAALLLALLAGGAGAQSPVSVRATLYSNSHDYNEEMSFALAEVTNPTARDQNYAIELSCRGGRMRYVVEGEGLRPGETRSIGIPAVGRPHQVRVRSDGRESTGSVSSSNPSVLALHLYTTSTKPGQSKEQDFYDEVERSRKDLLADPDLRSGAASWRYSGTTPPLAGPACFEASASFAPDDWRCYAMFPAVFVAESVWEELQRQPAGQAIERWVSTGGFLMLYDAESSGGERLGAGTIMRAKENMFDQPAAVLAKLPLNLRPQGWREFSSETWADNRGYSMYSGANNGGFPISTANETAYATPVTLSLLFFVLAGPVNFFWLRRKEKIRALFVTVPLLSVAFCLLITAAFFATAGFDRRSAVVSLTCVDQAAERSVTASRFMFYSGLYPGGGFRWSNDALFLPHALNNKTAAFNATRGLHLTAGLFEPLSEMHYLTVEPAETSEKLLLHADGSPRVANGFETDIEELYARVEGRWWRAVDVPRGGSANLEPVQLPGSVESARDPLAGLFDLLSADEENSGAISSMAQRLATSFYFYPDYAPGFNPSRELGRARAETKGDFYVGRFAGRPKNVVAGTSSLKDAGSWCFVAGSF